MDDLTAGIEQVPLAGSPKGAKPDASAGGSGPAWTSTYWKLATQSACSCRSLIGPHSFRTRLARKPLFECITAS
jgi:hypothetical protein